MHMPQSTLMIMSFAHYSCHRSVIHRASHGCIASRHATCIRLTAQPPAARAADGDRVQSGRRAAARASAVARARRDGRATACASSSPRPASPATPSELAREAAGARRDAGGRRRRRRHDRRGRQRPDRSPAAGSASFRSAPPTCWRTSWPAVRPARGRGGAGVRPHPRALAGHGRAVRAASRLFVQMLGVGFDAQVVHRLPMPLKRALGRGAYVAADPARAGALPLPADPHLRIDGRRRARPPASSSARGGSTPATYMLAPGADAGAAGLLRRAVRPRRAVSARSFTAPRCR